MFPLPALPLVPKLHRFFEPEQAKTFMLIFGIALLGQFLLPSTGPGWFAFSAGAIWPLIVGVGFVVLSFVPGLADKLKPNLLFLIVAGSGVLGVLWSWTSAGATGAMWWGGGLGLMGLTTMLAGLFLWARNGFQQLYWILVVSGLGGLALGLLLPIGGYGLPLIAIFTQIGAGGGIFGILAGIVSCILCLGFLFLIVLLVMNVVLKKGEADQEQVERFGSTFYIAALAIPVVVGIFGLPILSAMLHAVITIGVFLWLAVWGMVCFFEAKERGENLFAM